MIKVKRMVPKLLGYYENFPEVIHGAGRFICVSSKDKVRREILCTLHKLNEQIFGLKDITAFSPSECEVGFEFGMADGVEFSYLDEEELHRVLKGIVEKALLSLDFFCVLRYHIMKHGKRIPLKFDYYMLRFIFHDKDNLELLVSHERGVRRVSAEDLITFTAKRINEALSQSQLRPLELKNLRAP